MTHNFEIRENIPTLVLHSTDDSFGFGYRKNNNPLLDCIWFSTPLPEFDVKFKLVVALPSSNNLVFWPLNTWNFKFTLSGEGAKNWFREWVFS